MFLSASPQQCQGLIHDVIGGEQGLGIRSKPSLRGGMVRVGLEDSLWDGRGTLAETNAAQVRRIRTVIEALALEVATPNEAREMLKLKGRNNVAF